jgi:hypothetical protein
MNDVADSRGDNRDVCTDNPGHGTYPLLQSTNHLDYPTSPNITQHPIRTSTDREVVIPSIYQQPRTLETRDYQNKWQWISSTNAVRLTCTDLIALYKSESSTEGYKSNTLRLWDTGRFTTFKSTIRNFPRQRQQRDAQLYECLQSQPWV